MLTIESNNYCVLMFKRYRRQNEWCEKIHYLLKQLIVQETNHREN